MIRKGVLLSLFCAAVMIAGCGYTTRSMLPSNIKTIYVENFVNKINVTAEQTNDRMYRGYRPGMEVEVTKAVRDKFIFDGNLKIAPEGESDLVLRAELIDFRREPLRYDANDNIEEYRIKLIVNMEVCDADTGNVRWTEKGFSGETTYRTGGSLMKTESAAVKDATQDLARRIVERTIEEW